MSFRLVSCFLVLFSSLAAADEVVLTPVCGDVDATRDTFGETERELAKAQLVRVLQDLDQLVVEHDCAERYLVSHEQRDGDFFVRLAGPGGVRLARNPERAELQAVYSRMVTSLLDAQEAAAQAAADKDAISVATVEPSESTYADAMDAQPELEAVPPDQDRAVRRDGLLYGQLAVGNYGTGGGVGFRIPVSPATALDLSGVALDDGARFMRAFGAKLVKYASPQAAWSAYAGGGMSLGVLSAEGMGENAGARLEGSAGIMFNRTAPTRFFVQADLGLPLFAVEGGYEPSFIVSLGMGQ